MATTPATSGSVLPSGPGRWAIVLGLLFMVGVALVLLFLLTLATDNRAFYEANFARLVGINVAVAVVFLLVIVGLAVQLVLRLRRRRFGSQLMLKLAAIFSLVGFLPGLLVYLVSYQFVSRSIENWFDVRVESALSAGLSLGRTTLDTLAVDLANKTRVAAAGLAGSGQHVLEDRRRLRLRGHRRTHDVLLRADLRVHLLHRHERLGRGPDGGPRHGQPDQSHGDAGRREQRHRQFGGRIGEAAQQPR